LYGTNAGGHLIVEKWMTPDLFEGTNATDQNTLDQTDGAQAKLQHHWDTYYTKDDFAAMKKWGLNAVRIPIGFWAYDNARTPYLIGADVYLERMIQWCREVGLWVLVDCHGSPGSQNGFDNSGRAGEVEWQAQDNLDRSIAVLKIMAAKYGSWEYSDVVYGLQLVNEPISWNQSKLEVTQEWTSRAYQSVRDAAKNTDLVIVMHDGFMGPSKWTEVGNTIMGNYSSASTAGFALDTHLYQNQVDADKQLTQEEHIAKACAWKQTNLLPQNSTLPVFVGEFSAATDICANPDGSTVAGTACWIDGCQCANNVDIQWWQQPLKDVTRKFFEAELEAFEKGAQGWFVWSWKGPGGWGMENLIREGVVGQSVEDRKFAGQCD
jgi:glucan 1,3-beta-glucosidase